MSEEEIIKEVENYENWKVVYNPGGLYQFIPLPKDYKQAIFIFPIVYAVGIEYSDEFGIHSMNWLIADNMQSILQDLLKK